MLSWQHLHFKLPVAPLLSGSASKNRKYMPISTVRHLRCKLRIILGKTNESEVASTSSVSARSSSFFHFTMHENLQECMNVIKVGFPRSPGACHISCFQPRSSSSNEAHCATVHSGLGMILIDARMHNLDV